MPEGAGRCVNGITECRRCKSGYKSDFGFCYKRSCIVFNLFHIQVKDAKYPGRVEYCLAKGYGMD